MHPTPRDVRMSKNPSHAPEPGCLLWNAQGNSSSEIATIPGCAGDAVKVHNVRIFEKPGIEHRNAAAMRALEMDKGKVVAGGGIEPPTRGFSVLCSTN
jgi:hypothetical protein